MNAFLHYPGQDGIDDRHLLNNGIYKPNYFYETNFDGLFTNEEKVNLIKDLKLFDFFDLIDLEFQNPAIAYSF
jgi:hypothetical protein